MAKPRLARAALEDVRGIRVYSKAAFGPAVALDYVNGAASVPIIRVLHHAQDARTILGGEH